MKNLKKFALTIISLAVIMCVSVSCFGIFFVPVVSPVSGLPGYTLNQEYVTSTEAYLETAKKYTIEGKSNTDVNTAWSNFVYAYYEVASQTNVA